MRWAGRRLLLGALLPALALAQDAAPAGRFDTLPVPRGHGQLNQDVITLELHSGSLDIRVMPLDDRVTRLLAPDAEQSLQALLASRRPSIDSALARHGLHQPGLALVTFFARDNNTRFEPQLITISVRNRQIQPRATLPLSASFSSQVLDQREQAMGLYLFEEPIPVTEPFVVQYRDALNADWERRLSRLDRERARILSRLAAPDTPGVD
jgi:hypothetical protein